MSSDNPTREEVLASIVPRSDQLNADDLTTGISQVPETLVEGAMTAGSYLFGDNKNYVDVDTDALGVAADVVGALPVLGVAGKVTRPLLKSGSQYLTAGPLKNAYRLNPFAGKLGKYNRVVGPNAIEDLSQSGLVRAGDYGGSSMPGQPAWVGDRTTAFPSFGKGILTSDNVYAQRIIEQGKKPYIISTNRPMRVSSLGRHGKGKTQFPVDETNKYMEAFPASEAQVFEFGKPHWLRGYKPIEVPKQLPGSSVANYAPGGEFSPKDLDPATLEKYLSDLRDLENSIKKGYKNNKWYPHSSVEGGANTIAYGHKLIPGESFASGLTEQQARDLQKKDVLVHQARAEEYVDDKYGKGSYDKLPQNSQMLLTDYAYNLGSLNPFPSFVEGVVKGDKNKMLQEYERRGLPERNKWTQNVINTTDFSEDSDEGFDWFNPSSWFNKKNGGAIEIDIKNEKDLKEYINKGYIIEEL